MLLWVKALHVIFVVCWFAGLFYLPRLFVNHAMISDQATRAHLVLMQQRLYRFMTPFAWLTAFFGGWLLVAGWEIYRNAPWMHLKLAGLLDGVAGIVFGEFTGCDEKDAPYTHADVLDELARELGVPCAAGFDIGHGVVNQPVTMGATVKLNATAKTLEVVA